MAEQTSSTQQQTINYKELADRASTFMDADWIRPVQAAAYAELLSQYSDPMADLLGGADLETARKYADKSQPVPDTVKETIRGAYGELKASHQWLKGFIATTIAYSHPDAVGECKDSTDKRRANYRDKYLAAVQQADEEADAEEKLADQADAHGEPDQQ